MFERFTETCAPRAKLAGRILRNTLRKQLFTRAVSGAVMARHFIHHGYLNSFLMLPQGSARRRRRSEAGPPSAGSAGDENTRVRSLTRAIVAVVPSAREEVHQLHGRHCVAG